MYNYYIYIYKIDSHSYYFLDNSSVLFLLNFLMSLLHTSPPQLRPLPATLASFLSVASGMLFIALLGKHSCQIIPQHISK